MSSTVQGAEVWGEDGADPVWVPSAEEAWATNVAAAMRQLGFGSYEQLWRWSVEDRAAFWSWVVERLHIRFSRPPLQVLDQTAGTAQARWFVGARLNIVDSCWQAPPEAPAIVTGGADLRVVTYGRLRERVARVTGALLARGLGPGDAVAIVAPMTVDTVATYLGVVAAGMQVVSIGENLGPAEIATRLRIGEARLVFTTGGLRGPNLYLKVTQAAPGLPCVVAGADQPLREEDLGWAEFLAAGTPQRPIAADPEATTNLLFGSGGAGEPKAIPWTHLTPIKAAADARWHLDVNPDDVLACPGGLGGMMGPWLIYATLINRATMALSQDDPTTRAFGGFVGKAGVTMLGVVPSVVSAWRYGDRMNGLGWASVRRFVSTGEVSSVADTMYLMGLAGRRPVIEYRGSAEVGGAYVTGTLLHAARPTTFTTPALGSAFVLLDEAGRPTDRGEVFLIPPTLGLSNRLVTPDHDDIYFAGTPPGPAGEVLRRQGDELQRLPDGRYRALGRVDERQGRAVRTQARRATGG